MKFDDILSEIGDFGTYQKKKFVLLTVAWMLTPAVTAFSVFILGIPDHRCRIPGFANDTYNVQGTLHHNMIQMYIPLSNEDDKKYDQCHVYQIDQSNTVFDENNSHSINASLVKCSSWVYSNDVFDYTFVVKENLVCDNKYKVSVSKTVLFAGTLVGSFTFGLLSDLIGRRKTLLLAVLTLFGSCMTLAWSVNYTMFIIVRFFTGVGVVGMYITTFVIGMEWTGPSKRTFVGIFIATFTPGGVLLYILESYFIRTWNWIIIATAIPTGLYLIIWWFIPESPRWLCSKGRMAEAKALLQHAAMVNKTTFPDKMLDELTPDNRESGRVWLLFSDKTLACRTVIIFFNWMVVSMVFYGLSLNTGILYGDYYINFMLSVLVEYPANYAGKDLQPLTTTLALLGKLFSTAGFATIYIISAEVFPTVIRNAGMGSSSVWARVGGMISPYIADTADLVGGTTGKAVPLVIFGGACVLAALLTLILPETLNRQLPETIEDGKHFSRNIDKKKQAESKEQTRL
ncbi:OCTN [Mytilus edulis]|uniref:SLC22A4_5 n=1 Tax=Mytilus edulis TaxID=6550 RepID=A0A8S3VJY2_MYTED|nr:OCTN [Mytilus edulis]